MNIFVTVGAQMPFDRLIRAVDTWAARQQGAQFFAQVGEGGLAPANMPSSPLLEPNGFRAKVEWADVLVSHAGMGSILTALQYGKPVLVMPRRGALKETRNDHQVATAQRFKEMGKVMVAMDESELPDALSRLSGGTAAQSISAHASPELIEALRSFIQSARR